MAVTGNAEERRRRAFVERAGIGAAAFTGASAMSGLELQAQQGTQTPPPAKWDLEADVVVIGSGACGLPAAIRAIDHGASVIVVEANYDIGGHGIINGDSALPLGGGTSAQAHRRFARHPVQGSDRLVGRRDQRHAGVRYNDRGVQRALADNEAAAYDFCSRTASRSVTIRPACRADMRSASRRPRKLRDLGEGPERREPAWRRRHSLSRAGKQRERRASASC